MSEQKSILGITEDNTQLLIDVPRLIETRLLVQSNSGGGKSWTIRRLLEQTAGQVQQLVLDPEGEFSTLREKFDYIIAAPHDGDAVATPQTAKLLATRLLETRVSAIIDIYDLKAHERVLFVRRFLESLVNARRDLWHPCLVVVDEAHQFCPERGSAESAGAVIDLATRGRKRGLCAVLATQRLSKLHKDAAAELLNKLVGRTGLDVDVRRAADELGFTTGVRESIGTLRSLQPGQFYAFGPALSSSVEKVRIGPVITTHPEVGNRMITAPPAPSDAVRAVLAKLADLPQQAEEEARTTADLKRENAALKAKITKLEKEAPEAPSPRVIEQEVIVERIPASVIQQARGLLSDKDRLLEATARMDGALASFLEHLGEQSSRAPTREYGERRESPVTSTTPQQVRRQNQSPLQSSEIPHFRAGAIAILKELAARYPAIYTRPQVGTLTGYAHKGGTFIAYIGELKRAGLVQENGREMSVTEDGIRYLGDDVLAAPKTHGEVMAMWRKALRKGAHRMLEEIIVESSAEGIDRYTLARRVDMEVKGGTFIAYLGDLRRNGLITERDRILTANDMLWP